MDKIITFIVNNPILFGLSNFFMLYIVRPLKWIRAKLRMCGYIDKTAVHELEKYKNIHEGERCFIVGNGPSLNFKDLDMIANETTFGFNMVYLLFNKTKWRPTYYMVADQNVYLEMDDKINQLSIDNKFVGENCKKYGKLIDDAIYFYTVVSSKQSKMPKFSDSPIKYLHDGQTVAYFAIQMAVFMGFKNIYLIGFDFTYSKQINEHGDLVVDNSIKDHFSNDYRQIHHAPNVKKMILAFRQAARYAKSHNINIFNATRGGNLNEFERVDLESIL